MKFWRVGILATMLCLLMVAFAPALGAAQTTVVMLEEKRVNYNQWQHAVKEEYERLHPGVTIELVGQGGDPEERMLAYYAAGVQLDIGWYEPWLVPQWAKAGMLLDLTQYFERDAQQYADWYPASVDMFRIQGGLYGLPRDLQLPAVYYNIDSYNAAGLAMPTDGWTYDDLVTSSVRLRREDGAGQVTQWGFVPPAWHHWLLMIWNNGGDFLDNWVEPTRFTGDNPKTIESLEFLSDMREIGAIPPDEATFKPLQWLSSSFRQERIAQGISTSFTLDALMGRTDFNWDVVALPRGDGEYTSAISTLAWFIFSTSPNADAAWDVLKFYTGEWSLKQLATTAGTIPPSHSIIISDWLTSSAGPENKAAFVKGAEFAKPMGVVPDNVYGPINDHAKNVMWGIESTSSAMENMRNLVNVAIQENMAQ